MKIIIVLLFLNIALVWCNHSVEQFSNRNRQFSANIYKEVANVNSGNFVASPITLEIVLSLLHAGARGQTAAQLAHGLILPNNTTEINSIIRTAVFLLQHQPNSVTLKTATKMYLGDNLKISNNFINIAIDVFTSAIESINFNNPEMAASVINRWVSEQTNNYIKDLVSSEDINDATKAIFVNTLYFKALWLKHFHEIATKRSNFYIGRKQNVLVDMMSQIDNFEYHENDLLKAKFLKLPYYGNDLSMVLILPNHRDGLSYIEANIQEVLQKQRYNRKMVLVKIPKFKIDATVKFNPILQKLGIIDLFTKFANLDGICGNSSGLYIDNVIQKNYIEVNENGTVAASATAVDAQQFSMQYAEVEFIADHPFLYYIESSAGILFVGRYAGY